jgi:hypothetical protein
MALPKSYHLDVVGGPSIPHDPRAMPAGLKFLVVPPEPVRSRRREEGKKIPTRKELRHKFP